MEIHKNWYYQSESGQRSQQKNDGTETKEVAPGIPVVRSSTPRPISFIPPSSNSGLPPEIAQGESVPQFPAKAPSAPPLPEELGENASINTISLSQQPKSSPEDQQQFAWLFEYGLEMDTALLNSPQRLDGLALLYGPAVLKGHTVMFAEAAANGESTTVTIVPSSDPGVEVWGVLYRIPRRVAEYNGQEPSLLDSVHAAIEPQRLFKAMQVIVREIYREREVECIVYVIADSSQWKLRTSAQLQEAGEMLFLQRLATIARKQKLPDRYVNTYAAQAVPLVSSGPEPSLATRVEEAHRTTESRIEQNTDPLPILEEQSRAPLATDAVPDTPPIVSSSSWLVVFALYLAFLLLIILVFAVLQGMGMGSELLTSNFTPLGVPWLVLVYGLLGGCVSSIVSLGRFPHLKPPVFVVIIWFTRPYIGVVLATITYLLFTSGFFVLGESVGRHGAFFLLTGALAGLCEGFIFIKRR